jgi:hypothetical protein
VEENVPADMARGMGRHGHSRLPCHRPVGGNQIAFGHCFVADNHCGDAADTDAAGGDGVDDGYGACYCYGCDFDYDAYDGDEEDGEYYIILSISDGVSV